MSSLQQDADAMLVDFKNQLYRTGPDYPAHNQAHERIPANRYIDIVCAFYNNVWGTGNMCPISGTPDISAFPLALEYMYEPAFKDPATAPPVSAQDLEALDALAYALERNAQIVRELRASLVLSPLYAPE